MPKMDDDSLLSHLQALEDDASTFTHGQLAAERERNMREYYRMPYGAEEEGLSDIVTSEVQDTVEWILPDLLDIFTSSDKAVVFDPHGEEDVKGAEQATDTCNYVFYKQNNGFLTLYTAFKDALMVKNCAVHWRKETKRVKVTKPVKGATAEMLAMIMRDAGEDAQIESSDHYQQSVGVDPVTGDQISVELYDARISSIEEKKIIRVDAFQPENLLIQRDWTSPLLDDCPYVCRLIAVTLSELHEMGYAGVTAEELAGSDESQPSADFTFRDSRAGPLRGTHMDNPQTTDEDESRTEGFLRIEYVLVDYDGDGISERRCIYRLKDKILKNEEADQVPFATASPILIQHRWDGMSVAEIVSDLQQLRTEITRQMVDSGRLALNPRTKVLTDANWSPLARIDDLLDSRPGGLVLQRDANATQEMVTPWVGAQMFPMLEYLDAALTRRTGVSGQSQGIDVNALNRGGRYEMRVMNSAQKRIKLIARIFAEILLKPIFQGILKLLTDGEMEKIAFRLRNEFVEYDPSEWRDSYDMTANVGLGTGDREQQLMALQIIAQQQAGIAMSPFGPLLVTPKTIYNTQSRIVEYSGFKNVADFYSDPGDKMPAMPPPMPPPQVMVEQMRLSADAQKFQAETVIERQKAVMDHEAKMRETRAQLELQALNDQRDAERELLKAQHDAQVKELQTQIDKYKIDQDNATRIAVAQISHPPQINGEPSDIEQAALALMKAMSAPKINRMVRGADGRVSEIITEVPPPDMQEYEGMSGSARSILALAKSLSTPKTNKLIRDASGRVAEIVTEPQTFQ